jgi:hypothetical protein
VLGVWACRVQPHSHQAAGGWAWPVLGRVPLQVPGAQRHQQAQRQGLVLGLGLGLVPGLVLVLVLVPPRRGWRCRRGCCCCPALYPTSPSSLSASSAPPPLLQPSLPFSLSVLES